MKTLKWIIVVVKVLVLTGCGGAAKQQAAASDPAEKPLVFHNSEELPAPDSDTLSALEDAVHQQIEKDSANAGFIVSGVGDGEEGHLYPAEDEIWAGMELGAHKGMGG